MGSIHAVGGGKAPMRPTPGGSHTRGGHRPGAVKPYSETAEPLVEGGPWQLLITEKAF